MVGDRGGAVAPCGISRLVGNTVTVEGSLLVKVTNSQSDAGAPRVKEYAAVWPSGTVTVDGRMSPDPPPGVPPPDAVIVTVAGLLAVTPLFTVNCATYVPDASATKVGDTVLDPESVALLPLGRIVNDHA